MNSYFASGPTDAAIESTAGLLVGRFNARTGAEEIFDEAII
jgi:hypothetical protein